MKRMSPIRSEKENMRIDDKVPDSIVVLPGDNVTEHIFVDISESGATSSQGSKVPKLGPGLRCDTVTKQVFATLAGALDCQHSKRVYFVRQSISRYRPTLEDRVVGIVQERLGPDGLGGDVFQIQVGASHSATLSNLQFEGATKRNKPAFAAGQLIYARVSNLFNGYLDPALSCLNGPFDVNVPRKDWMTNEGAYGELRGGTMFKVTPAYARQLLLPDHVVFAELALSKLAFEVAIGVNGYVWLHSTHPEYTILIQNAVLNAEVLTEPQIRSMIKSIIYTVRKQMHQDQDAIGG